MFRAGSARRQIHLSPHLQKREIRGASLTTSSFYAFFVFWRFRLY